MPEKDSRPLWGAFGAPPTDPFGAPPTPLGRPEQLPFPDQSVDIYTLQSAPIRPGTITELARVIRPGGDIRLVGPNTPEVLAAHEQIANAVGGRVYQTVVGDCVFTNVIVPAR
jgi:hypothetical protein